MRASSVVISSKTDFPLNCNVNIALVRFTSASPVFAILFVRNAGKKKDKECTDNYGTEGMCLGMCLGTAIGTSLGNNTGIGISMGMLIGLAIGTSIQKADNEKDNDEK